MKALRDGWVPHSVRGSSVHGRSALLCLGELKDRHSKRQSF